VPDTSTPKREIPDKSELEISAFRKLTLGPTMYPERNTYPVGGVAVVVPTSPPVVMLVTVAPVMITPDISLPDNVAPDRSTFVKLTDVSRTFGPMIEPARATYPSGRMVVENPRQLIEYKFVIVVELANLVAEISVLLKITFVRLAKVRFAPPRDLFVKSCPERSRPT